MKQIYDRLAVLFAPILRLPFGDKIAHFIMGNLVLFFLFWDVGLLDLSILALFFGLVIELSQKLFLIKPFNVFDILATWAGGTFGAFCFFYFGFNTCVKIN